MTIFETAARKKYRFPSPVGEITTEQLWDLPLTASGNRPNLDGVARALNAELKGLTEESFVSVSPDPRKGELEIKLDIAKHIIAVKLDEKARAEKAADRADQRRKLIDALASKEEQEITAMSKDDIMKKLAELDG